MFSSGSIISWFSVWKFFAHMALKDAKLFLSCFSNFRRRSKPSTVLIDSMPFVRAVEYAFSSSTDPLIASGSWAILIQLLLKLNAMNRQSLVCMNALPVVLAEQIVFLSVYYQEKGVYTARSRFTVDHVFHRSILTFKMFLCFYFCIGVVLSDLNSLL